MKELDLLYSPSQWCNKPCSADDIIENHVKFVTNASDRARKNVPCQLNIPYGSGPNEKLDIFGIDLPKDSPIFIYIHGGYWQDLNREISSYMAEPLHKNNFKLIVIGYDLCPAVSLSDIIDEVQKAFNYCRNYARSNQSRGLYIGGHSAGAHLAACLFTSLSADDQALVKEVYFLSGVFDLVPLVDTYVNEALKLDISTAKKLSPQHQPFTCTDGDVKFHVVVGEHDTPPFKSQASAFNDKLRAHNLKTDLVFIRGKDHFDIAENLNDETNLIIRMIVGK